MKHPAKLVDYQFEKIILGLKKLELAYSETHLKRLYQYIELLYSYNRKFSLFSKNDEDILAVKHILPAISLSRYIYGKKWLDIGSGAGFPAIPAKIFLDDVALTLVDSSRKKVLFLLKVIKTLGLPCTEALNIRVETIEGKREFETITALAVEDPTLVITSASKLLVNGGYFIWIRGRRWSEFISSKKEYFEKNLSLELVESIKLPSFFPSPRLYANILRKSFYT